MPFEQKTIYEGPSWSDLNPLNLGGTIEKYGRIAGQKLGILDDPNSPMNRARRAASQGDYESLRELYPDINPRSQSELSEADNYRRMLQADEAKAGRNAKNQVWQDFTKQQQFADRQYDRRFNLNANLQKQLSGMGNASQEKIAGINSQTQLGVAGIGLQGIKYQTDSGERLGRLQNDTQRFGITRQYNLGMAQDRTTQRGQSLNYNLGMSQNQTQRDLGSAGLRNEATRDRMNAWLQSRRGIEDVLKTAFNRSSFR